MSVMSTRRYTKALLATALLIAAILIAPAPAQASTPQISGSASIRFCVNLALPGCKDVGKFSAGSVTMVCWKDQSSATGAYTSARWFWVTQSNGKQGWAHSSWVTRQVTVPNCSGNRAVRIATWAAETVGQVNASRAVADYLWGAGSDPRWSGGCAGLASASVKFGAGANPRYRDNARPMYDAYRRAGKMRSYSSTPTPGSVVFWPNSTSLGHAAVVVGNAGSGMVIATTMGYIGESKANALQKVNYIGNPSGWVSAGDM